MKAAIVLTNKAAMLDAGKTFMATMEITVLLEYIR